MLRNSKAEEFMLALLKKKKQPMSLNEIVEEIQKRDPSVFSGETPHNSLYSIIYKREAKRRIKSEKTLFRKIKNKRAILYIPNI